MLRPTNLPCLQLLSPHRCLLSNLQQPLSQQIVSSHQLSYSPNIKAYMFGIQMLSSLKRNIIQKNITEDLPIEIIIFLKNVYCTKPLICRKIKECVGPWKLLPHQLTDINFFFKRGGKIIIGDGWGMGKTVTAIAIAELLSIRIGMVICSQIMIKHWFNHLSEVYPQQSIRLSFDKRKKRTKTNQQQFYIISHQNINKLTIQDTKFQFIIIDEPIMSSHCYSNLKPVQHMLILTRKAQQHLINLLQIIKSNVPVQAIKNRYQLMDGKATSHIHEYRQLTQHTLIIHKQLNHNMAAPIKPILLSPKKKIGRKIKHMNQQQQIFNIYNNYIEQIGEYIYHIANTYNETIIVAYCNQPIAKAVQNTMISIEEKYNIKIELMFRDIKENKQIQFIKPGCLVLILDSPNANYSSAVDKSIDILHNITPKLQFIKLSQNDFEIIKNCIVYPNLVSVSDYIESNSICQEIQGTNRKIIAKKKQIIVYYDQDEPDNELHGDEHQQNIQIHPQQQNKNVNKSTNTKQVVPQQMEIQKKEQKTEAEISVEIINSKDNSKIKERRTNAINQKCKEQAQQMKPQQYKIANLSIAVNELLFHLQEKDQQNQTESNMTSFNQQPIIQEIPEPTKKKFKHKKVLKVKLRPTQSTLIH